MDVLRAAEILINKIKKDYKDDIALVVMMGSHLYNDTHKKSDLDMYFIPKTERGHRLGMVFIIDGIGFDFWPISWDRIKRIGNYDERIGAIITEGKILYYGNDADLAEFETIKASTLNTSVPDRFYKKAKSRINDTYKAYFDLSQSGTLSDTRYHAMSIVNTLAECISLTNLTTIKRGRGKLKKEILAMKHIPKDFEALYDTVFMSDNIQEIKNAYYKLIQNTVNLITEVSKPLNTKSFKVQMTGFFEEIINAYNKIERACEIKDHVTPLFAAHEIYREFSSAFENTGLSASILPDLLAAYNKNNLEQFAAFAKDHQLKLEKLIESHGVVIQRFNDFKELEKHLELL